MEIEELYKKYLIAGNVSTDTRKILAGSMFFALRGDKFNANEFAAEALAKGARYAVIDDEEFVRDENYFVVPNVLQTLQKLARHHRNQLKIPVIALTGSNGKTTTKELIAAVLRTGYKTSATQGNLNNHIGVPLTLLAIDHTVEMAVVEMGANHVGEIADLCQIANPTHGLITNIGRAHIGTFGGLENIVKGKTELYKHLLENGGTAFINTRNHLVESVAKQFTIPITYPAKGDFYPAKLLSSDPFVIVEADNGDEVATHLVGSYNFENVAAALCIGKFFGIDARTANHAVMEYVPGNMRSQIVMKGSNTIILDAYNANPSSMMAAIENLANIKANRKVLILGDMYELEEETEKEHRMLGAIIKERNIKEVYLCGEYMKFAHELIPSSKHFTRKEDLEEELSAASISNATILIKASRGIGLETVMDSI